MDKVGHMQSAYSIGYISSQMWQSTGIFQRRSVIIGAITGFTYLTAIEIMDGYSTGWGFSYADLVANACGASLLIGQELIWRHQRIQPKFGFQRSDYAPLRPELLGSGFHEEILKDYNGQTYWLSFNVASWLSYDSKFPRWLNVAVGYGANGMTGGHENPVMYNSAGNTVTINRYRQYYFSLDIDTRKIPTRSKFLRAFFNIFSFIKIPAPALEVNKFGVRGHVIKF